MYTFPWVLLRNLIKSLGLTILKAQIKTQGSIRNTVRILTHQGSARKAHNATATPSSFFSYRVGAT